MSTQENPPEPVEGKPADQPPVPETVVEQVPAKGKPGRKKGTPNKRKTRIPGVPDMQNPKTAKSVEKIVKIMEAHHEQTDDQLLEKIKVKPENEHKLSHQLDKEQLDARLVLMHRLLIRKVSPTDIQKQLNISQEMYYYLRPKLDQMMRLDVAKLDVPYMIGDSLALYDEIRAMALMIASSGQVKDQKTKLQAMQVVLKAESDKNAFLTQCGVYAPQIIEHLIHGMVNSGATLLLSGPSKETTRRVEDMVDDLMKVLAVDASARQRKQNAMGDDLDVEDLEPGV